MDGNPILQVFDDLFPYLEALETRSNAILLFLKDKNLISDEEFAPYLKKAGNASDIKWLGARKRIEYLLSSMEKKEEDKQSSEAKSEKAAHPKAEKASETSEKKADAEDTDAAEKNVRAKKDNGHQPNKPKNEE